MRFNPRAREGRDKINRLNSTNEQVSIHAPAKGATLSVIAVVRGCRVSIHAPAKGATTTAHPPSYDILFQSTRPRRARLASGFATIDISTFQSTRPRRARLLFRLIQMLEPRFNPRAREGRDSRPVALQMTCMMFQSTRPRRARLFVPFVPPISVKVSIHAPAKGATLMSAS